MPDTRIYVPKVNYHGLDVFLHCGGLAWLLSKRSQTCSYTDNEGVEPDRGQSDLCVYEGRKSVRQSSVNAGRQ